MNDKKLEIDNFEDKEFPSIKNKMIEVPTQEFELVYTRKYCEKCFASGSLYHNEERYYCYAHVPKTEKRWDEVWGKE